MLLLAAAAFAASVTPQLGWAPGDRWDVRYTATQESTSGGTVTKASTAASWTWSVTGKPGALVVTPSGITITVTGLTDRDATALYAQALAAAPPTWTVGLAAALAPLDLAPLRSAAAAVLDARKGVSADARAAALRGFGDRRLQAVAGELWDDLVGRWAGSPLVQGQAEAYVSTTPVASLGDAAVEQESTRTFDGPAPCASGAPTCERFSRRSVLSPSAASVAIASFNAGSAGMKVSAATVETTAALVTDASDLRPVSLQVTRRTHTRGTAGTLALDTSQVLTRTWAFTKK